MVALSLLAMLALIQPIPSARQAIRLPGERSIAPVTTYLESIEVSVVHAAPAAMESPDAYPAGAASAEPTSSAILSSSHASASCWSSYSSDLGSTGFPARPACQSRSNCFR
eukprot:8377472-Pyramimonas_sp.AAC.1